MKKLLLLFIIILLSGCKNNEFSKNIFYMDTLINIKVYNINEKKANEAFANVESIYKKYHEITNFYDENSELYKINNTNYEVNISNELKDLIDLGLTWYNKSNGLFNINIGLLSKTWHDFRETKIFPNKLDYDIDISNVKLNGNAIKGNFNIDLGGIVKGYVTEMAGNYLESVGIDHYIINAGGNVKVGKSNKGYYNIGISSPEKNEVFYIIKDEDISVVTSGGYERFYEYEGVLYHHIIDPKTKYPANYMKSVTVIGDDSSLCDLLSTTLFLMSVEEGIDFIKDYDVSAIWYTNNNEIIKSEGFKYE